MQVGLFATSPGDLTLRRVGLGGAIEEVRFTQATGVFDNVTLDGGAAGAWRSDRRRDGPHRLGEVPPRARAVETDGVLTVSGTGDIGPGGEEAAWRRQRLPGLVIALIIVLVVAARYGAAHGARPSAGPWPPGPWCSAPQPS